MAPLSNVFNQGPKGDVCKGLEKLRYTVLVDGIPSNNDGMSELRIYIWLVLLSAPPVPTDRYVDLVRQGPSPSYAKIRNDTFRTLATDPLFRRRVTESSLTRVLNAVSWKLHDAHEALVNGWQSPPSIGSKPPLSFSGSPESKAESPAAQRHAREMDSEAATSTTAPEGSTVSYVQGMNVLAAPFLYAARSEVQAFAAFNTFINNECPGYVRGGSMDGVHRGLALVDKVLSIVDPKLFNHLMDCGMKANIYGFASVLTLCACTPPLPEVLNLWDFLFAYGPHLNLLCIVGQLILIRDQLLASPSPNQILRSLPALQSAKIKAMAISFIRKIPNEIYDEIVLHAK
ncbi:MAG: hypothetical protein M1828_001937 [Chrysothrix sp. TS-e1954]|nr:MAG: hypothetical protein M1828_001937 [Chrysothrix sp. TS-e1954]